MRCSPLSLLLLAGACVMTTAFPTELESDPNAIGELRDAVLSVIHSDQNLRQQLADTLAAVKESQLGVKQFLETRENSVEGLRDIVAEALGNAGLATAAGPTVGNLTAELHNLNNLFRNYLTMLSCPAPFKMIGNECFSFILEDVTWEAARQKCLELGADLATPSDVTTLRLYVTTRYPRKGRRNFWIGGQSQNKIWEWLTGDPIDERYWYTNEPSGNGECLAMFDGWENPFTDFPCENERRAICQRPLGK